MLARISARLFAEWTAYYEIEPWGEARADYRNGILAATVANVNRDPHTRAYEPQDFMPDFDPTPQTWQEQKAMFEALTAGVK